MKNEDVMDIVQQEAFNVLKNTYLPLWQNENRTDIQVSVALGLSNKWLDPDYGLKVVKPMARELDECKSTSNQIAICLKHANTFGEFAFLMNHVISFHARHQSVNEDFSEKAVIISLIKRLRDLEQG